MNLYGIFSDKYKNQTELYKFIEVESNEIAKRLEISAIKCEKVIKNLKHCK